MIPSQKLRKTVIDKVVRCLERNKNNKNVDIWTQVADLLKDDIGLSYLEIKELYYKEILPLLNTNNYGYDEATVKVLQNLGRVELKNINLTESQEQFKKIDEAMQKVHSTTEDDVFSSPNDQMKVSTECFPRKSMSHNIIFDELHIFPIYDEFEKNLNQPQRSENGNVRVRDEFGSSLGNPQNNCTIHDHRRASYDYMRNYPMYNFETGRVETLVEELQSLAAKKT